MLGLKLCSKGTFQEQRVRLQVFATGELNNKEKFYVTITLKQALRVDEDINHFYTMAQKDKILSDVVKDLYGMRTVAWPELFPALILAVTLQMAPWKRSNEMMNQLIHNFGETINFDEKTVSYWPSIEKIAATSVEDLRKAKLGYRARNLQSIARSLKNGFPTMQQLNKMPPAEAKNKLLRLRGIGDYSADIVIPGIGFPLDVWSAKIFHFLLMGEITKSPRDAIPMLKKIAEHRWGKWSGYVFTYILNDLPQISKRIKFDLTRL